MIYDVAIIGSGAAGLTAALYLTRAGKKVALIHGEYGGQAAKSPLIENFPGFKGAGVNLIDSIYNEITLSENLFDFFVPEKVETIISNNHEFVVFVGRPEEDDFIVSKYLIWATGCEHMTLNVPGNDCEHIHYCVTCDGPLYKNKSVAVIGDGNSAVQYALELSTYCKEVSLFTLTGKLFAEQVLIDRLLDTENIHWYKNFATEKFEEANGVTFIHGKDRSYGVDGVFIAIGQKPNNMPISSIFQRVDEKGFIVTLDTMECGENAYAVGDCRSKKYRQVITACSDGAIAALDIIGKLNLK